MVSSGEANERKRLRQETDSPSEMLVAEAVKVLKPSRDSGFSEEKKMEGTDAMSAEKRISENPKHCDGELQVEKAEHEAAGSEEKQQKAEPEVAEQEAEVEKGDESGGPGGGALDDGEAELLKWMKSLRDDKDFDFDCMGKFDESNQWEELEQAASSWSCLAEDNDL